MEPAPDAVRCAPQPWYIIPIFWLPVVIFLVATSAVVRPGDRRSDARAAIRT